MLRKTRLGGVAMKRQLAKLDEARYDNTEVEGFKSLYEESKRMEICSWSVWLWMRKEGRMKGQDCEFLAPALR